MKNLFTLLLVLTGLTLGAQAQNDSQLVLREIMKGEDFVGYLPGNVRWSDDSKYIYFSWNPDGDTLRSTYKADVATKKISKLTIDELKALTDDGEYTKDYGKKVYASNGDIFLMDNKNFAVRQITNTLVRESNPGFSGDEKSVIFNLDNNLYSWTISDGSLKQLTDFKDGNKRSSKKDAAAEWLENDQMANIEILRKRKGERDARKYRNELIEPKRPKTIYTGDLKLAGMWPSPDLQYVVYRIYKDAKAKNTMVPDYVTESSYTEELRARPNVGGPENEFESWVYDIKGDTTYQIKTDNIEGIFDKPKFMKDYAKNPSEYKDTFDKPRSVIIGQPIFSNDGKAVMNITSQDNKDRWIMTLDLASGQLKLIDRQHDDAWIGGPGVGWFANGVIGWIDNDNIYFQSEVTGYSHLYTANVNNGKTKALTKGDFEILDVQLSKDKKTFYLTSNMVSPHEQHFYHLPVKGGKMVQITSLKGGHEVTVSPDEKKLAVRYSYSNKPWEVYLMPNQAGAKMEQLTTSTTKEFNSYKWRDPEIIQFEAADGAKVPATLYEPAADKKNGAAVIFVHGAGYLQNVHRWWPSYFREYMFNNMLADNGYTVLAIDFRASAGYGRDWRTAIYRHMGGKDLSDQVDGAKYLVEQHGVDKDRIGLYGGSYGGFITLMALFKEADTFKSGAALRSVTDWSHYNHGYTSNILNTPTQDSLAYARSSPLYFAEGLKGNLLILHGMVDTNVHFQDVVRLSQRLIELGKENWEMAVFPMESHGFIEASSWADEYRRIFELFNKTLLKK
ncbi:MAG TPA: prolyl oligopeptidase family serine peptidase [Fulvivirga sp.]|nr:prolyl oligopeptidase family serine peptidase [Fulvivirga sp.]